MAREKGLNVSRGPFFKAIVNPVYSGKIVVPAHGDEPLEIVVPEEIPLRGFIACPKCKSCFEPTVLRENTDTIPIIIASLLVALE